MLCTCIPNKIAGTTKKHYCEWYYCILLEAIKGGGKGSDQQLTIIIHSQRPHYYTKHREREECKKESFFECENPGYTLRTWQAEITDLSSTLSSSSERNSSTASPSIRTGVSWATFNVYCEHYKSV